MLIKNREMGKKQQFHVWFENKHLQFLEILMKKGKTSGVNANDLVSEFS